MERRVLAVQSLSSFVGGKMFTEKCLDENGKLNAVIFIFGESRQNCTLVLGFSKTGMGLKLKGERVHKLGGFKDFSLGENRVFTIIDQKDKKTFLLYKDGKLTCSGL